jgi:hypothetical protein
MSAFLGRVPGFPNLHFRHQRKKKTEEKILVSHSGPIPMRILFLDDGIVYTEYSLYLRDEDKKSNDRQNVGI